MEKMPLIKLNAPTIISAKDYKKLDKNKKKKAKKVKKESISKRISPFSKGDKVFYYTMGEIYGISNIIGMNYNKEFDKTHSWMYTINNNHYNEECNIFPMSMLSQLPENTTYLIKTTWSDGIGKTFNCKDTLVLMAMDGAKRNILGYYVLPSTNLIF